MLIENRLLKKSVLGDGEERFMRYSASEKLEIIELVEQSSLSSPPTLTPIGIPTVDVLRLVQPIPGGRYRRSGGRQAQAATDLEQDP